MYMTAACRNVVVNSDALEGEDKVGPYATRIAPYRTGFL
jgi:hypothetical protein